MHTKFFQEKQKRFHNLTYERQSMVRERKINDLVEPIPYTMDTDHLVITAKPLKTLEKNTLTKTHVKIKRQQNKHIIMLPPKIYNFYHFDEKTHDHGIR